jgi:YD repeat-containing protein
MRIVCSDDAQNRLKSADYPAAIPTLVDETFVYDAVGNRKERSGNTSYAYDANDRITQSPEWPTIGSDNDGNVTTRTNGARVQTLVWDRLNQLTSFADTQGSISATYKYDGFAFRTLPRGPAPNWRARWC